MRKLTNRERLSAYVLVVTVSVWGLFAYCIGPVRGRIETLSRVIPEKKQVLERLEAEGLYYCGLREQMVELQARAASQQGRFELLTFLESLASRVGIAQKVAMMKQNVLELDEEYQQIIVEVELEGVTLEKVVDFLVGVKSSDYLLQVKSLYMEKSDSQAESLDAVIQISTLKSHS